LLACGRYHFFSADGDVGTGHLMAGQQTHHCPEAAGHAWLVSFTSRVLAFLLLLLLAEPATTVTDLGEATANVAHIRALNIHHKQQ